MLDFIEWEYEPTTFPLEWDEDGMDDIAVVRTWVPVSGAQLPADPVAEFVPLWYNTTHLST